MSNIHYSPFGQTSGVNTPPQAPSMFTPQQTTGYQPPEQQQPIYSQNNYSDQYTGQNQYGQQTASQPLKPPEEFNAHEVYIIPSTRVFPAASLKTRLGQNFMTGAVCRALSPLGPSPIPSVSHVGTIIRCRKCRTYINPFCKFDSGGRRWNCNMCWFSNETPSTYFSALNDIGERMDLIDRPELHCGSVEFIAPSEYMVRPPQQPAFLFLIDVSPNAIASGSLSAACNGIKKVLSNEEYTSNSRTSVGIITFDTSIHFYNFNSGYATPQMIVLSDLSDMFVPMPTDVLVNLSESKELILSLLDQLPIIHKMPEHFIQNPMAFSSPEVSLHSALKAAYISMKQVGGKLVLFLSSNCKLELIGDQSAKPSNTSNSVRTGPIIHSNQSNSGTNQNLSIADREFEYYCPAISSFSEFANELTKVQVSVDVFCFTLNNTFIDLGTIAPLARKTGGDLFFYPKFNQYSVVTSDKISDQIHRLWTRENGWEAVMRIRVSKGFKISEFYGSLFTRGTDLLVIPNCHADQTIGINIIPDMDSKDGGGAGYVGDANVVSIQCALLYTNNLSERRIRVHTTQLPVTTSMNSVFEQTNSIVFSYLWFNHFMSSSMKSQLSTAGSTSGTNTSTKALTLLKNLANHVVSFNIFPSMNELPYYVNNNPEIDLNDVFYWAFAISKSFLFRPEIPTDVKTYALMRCLGVSDLEEFKLYMTPKLLQYRMNEEVARLPLNSLYLQSDAIYILQTGFGILIWIGQEYPGGFESVLYVEDMANTLDVNLPYTLSEDHLQFVKDAGLKEQIDLLVNEYYGKTGHFLGTILLPQGCFNESIFFTYLIEDRTNAGSSIVEYIGQTGFNKKQATVMPSNPTQFTDTSAPQMPTGTTGTYSNGTGYAPAAQSYAQTAYVPPSLKRH